MIYSINTCQGVILYHRKWKKITPSQSLFKDLEGGKSVKLKAAFFVPIPSLARE
jgi:hypothetical protein